MKNITEIFDRELNRMKDMNWDSIYVLIDIHNTIATSNYSNSDLATDYYPKAIDALRLMSNDKNICLILWSSCTDKMANNYMVHFNINKGIKFKYFNENPEVSNSAFASYEKKPYFNVCIDDKAGFDPQEDWKKIVEWYENKNKS